jgi:arginyl-tRNA synthetase
VALGHGSLDARLQRDLRAPRISHELVRGESWYEPLLMPALERVKAAGITEISQGALVVTLGELDKGLKETPCLLQQTNGTTLYATRDLAALFSRWEEFGFERCLYVVGGEQKLHFRQLKAVLKRMGCDWEARVEHVDFGLLLGPGKREDREPQARRGARARRPDRRGRAKRRSR